MSEANVAVKVEEVSPVKAKLLFDVAWDDVKKEIDAVFREVGKTAKIKGFRKGKVPRNILEAYYKDYAEGEAVTNLINRFYWDALKTHDIKAVTPPEIEQNGIEANKNFNFTATVEKIPAVEPQGYTGLELEKPDWDVTDRDIDNRIEEIRQMFATLEEVGEERGVQEGDFVNLDFSGAVDGVKRDELEANNFMLEIGSGRFIPGFEEQLVGTAKGATTEIKVTFPADYYVNDVAGKEALFTVNVLGIKEKKLPLLDQSFVENFQKYESMEELRGDIRKSLEEKNRSHSENEIRNSMIEKLLTNNVFEVPPSYVEREMEYIADDARRRMASEGLSKQEADEISGKFHDQYRERAVRVVKTATLIDSIAARESIGVEESEIESKIEEIAAQSRDSENTKKYLRNDGVKNNLRREILHNKVFDFIEKSSQVKIVKKDASATGEESK